MQLKKYPVIDMAATGRNITRLRKARGLTVREVQNWFGFEEPQAVYKWQGGKSLPSVDNLYALSVLLQVPMDRILVSKGGEADTDVSGQQAESCCPDFFAAGRCSAYPVRSRMSFNLQFTLRRLLLIRVSSAGARAGISADVYEGVSRISA